MIAKFQYITGNKRGSELLKGIKSYCRSGGQWVQLRMKNDNFKEVLEIAIQAKKITNHYNARLIINDFPNIARAVNAYGVHLGKEDLSAKEARGILFDHQVIGSTCNSMEDIQEIAKEGESDYIGLGPFRYTNTKEKLSPVLGLSGLESIVNQCENKGISIPIVAVGGIEKEDLETLFQTNIHGVAASGLVEKEENLISLLENVERMTKKEIDYAKFEISQ